MKGEDIVTSRFLWGHNYVFVNEVSCTCKLLDTFRVFGVSKPAPQHQLPYLRSVVATQTHQSDSQITHLKFKVALGGLLFAPD